MAINTQLSYTFWFIMTVEELLYTFFLTAGNYVTVKMVLFCLHNIKANKNLLRLRMEHKVIFIGNLSRVTSLNGIFCLC